MDPTIQLPIRATPRAAHKTDLFAVFVLALTIGAVASQLLLVIWLSSR